MKVLFLFVGKTNDAYVKEGLEVYLKRLKNYLQYTVEIVLPSGYKEQNKAMKEEGEAILSKISRGDFVVGLDEHGKQLTSMQLASMMEKWMVQGISRVVFITGGAFGLSAEVKARTNYLLSASSFTFTHQMIRLILAEQLYRAMTILRNENYHHE